LFLFSPFFEELEHGLTDSSYKLIIAKDDLEKERIDEDN
jgi:hypothetical protein